MARVTFRPSTRSDIDALGLDLAWRIRGMTAVRDGTPVALGGLTYLPNGIAFAFLECYGEVKDAPIAFTRAVKRGLADARERGVLRIVALADEGVEAAARWLERLGFTRHGDLWVWEA